MQTRFIKYVLALAVLSPLGLLAKGSAWGEWAPDELQDMLGFIPRGVDQASEWWHALLPDYTVRLLGEGRLAEMAGYVLSALLGSALIYGATLALGKLACRSKHHG